MPARSPRPRSCTIEVRRVHAWSYTATAWESISAHRSVRAAKRQLSTPVDYLSNAMVEVRLRFADGSTRDITDRSRTQWALGVARAEQKYNSIGACLRRGETVCV